MYSAVMILMVCRELTHCKIGGMSCMLGILIWTMAERVEKFFMILCLGTSNCSSLQPDVQFK